MWTSLFRRQRKFLSDLKVKTHIIYLPISVWWQADLSQWPRWLLSQIHSKAAPPLPKRAVSGFAWTFYCLIEFYFSAHRCVVNKLFLVLLFLSLVWYGLIWTVYYHSSRNVQIKCLMGVYFSVFFVAHVANVPLIYPVDLFLKMTEKQETARKRLESCFPYIFQLCLSSCLLFLQRAFTPWGIEACPLLCFPSWSSAPLIMKRCSFLLPCLGLRAA